MKEIIFDEMEIIMINEIMKMIIFFFPKQTEIHNHACIIHERIEDKL